MNIAHIEIKGTEQLLQKRNQKNAALHPIGLADCAVYHYVKEGSLFSKKEERCVFYFFSGLNANPQNLSIFLRDEVQKENKHSKEKLVKGQFVVYDMFNGNDCVVEISIPGNFQIYKLQAGSKQLISNSEIDMMYVSAVVRAMYQRNISWGRCYNLFQAPSMIDEFRSFLHVFLKVAHHKDIFISDDFENQSPIKGSHMCSILLEYIKSQGIIHHSIEFLEAAIAQAGGYTEVSPKIVILLGELYSCNGKYAKSLSVVGGMLNKYLSDPFLLYYQAKYMLKLMAVHEAQTIVDSIIQFNQFEIWILAAQIHTELKNYVQVLACLNHASKIASKGAKHSTPSIDLIYEAFNELGKPKLVQPTDDIVCRPRLMLPSRNPMAIGSLVEEKYRSLVESDYWKMSEGQKAIVQILRTVRYRLEGKKFQELIESAFEERKSLFNVISFKKGMTESMFVEVKAPEETLRSEVSKYEEELPHFLQDESVEVEVEEIVKGSRNLSIIPELESVIENSQFQEKEKEAHRITPTKYKKEMSEHLYKILRVVLGEGEYERAEHEENWAKILPVYNKLRTSSKTNNYYAVKMFEIMVRTENYKSMIVLIAESLDLMEQNGIRKIESLPWWMNKFVFQAIEEKGLKYIYGLLEKLKFLDEAVLDTIEMAKSWKIKGCTF